MMVADDRAQEQEDHHDHQRRSRSPASPARRPPRARIEIERSINGAHVDRRAGSARARPAAWRATGSTTATVLASGWRWIASTMARVVVEPARDLVVLDAVDDARDLVELDRRAVAPGDHHVAVVGGLVHRRRWPAASRSAAARAACRPARWNWPWRRRCGCRRARCCAPRPRPDRPARARRISARRRPAPGRRRAAAKSAAPARSRRIR